ncbi:MAG: hypothetical protein GY711_18570 [bacterium]|nr:hypothetical protein [bacterium]
MPVWHEALKAARKRDDFVMIGITQEQHPDRCRLYAQWQGIDWPILWDPFNLTDSYAVPIFLGVDEIGFVREQFHARKGQEAFAAFLDTMYPANQVPPAGVPPTLQAQTKEAAQGRGSALARMLWGGHEVYDEAIEAFTARAVEGDATARDSFELGVALRLRYDSLAFRPADFQDSLASWTQALTMQPRQYIWRRRIQQWGPVLDKPYPFYGWVAEARKAIEDRGEKLHPVAVGLTSSELARKSNEMPPVGVRGVNPDPEGKIEADPGALVHIESAAALHTGIAGGRARIPAGTARIHVALRPDVKRDVHYSNEAGPVQVWVEVPEEWRIDRNLFTVAGPPNTESSSDVRRFDFEVVPPLGPPPVGVKLKAFALYYVCDGEDGLCVYRRQDFEIPIPLPALGGPPDTDEGR